jgi:uncharacterized protein
MISFSPLEAEDGTTTDRIAIFLAPYPSHRCRSEPTALTGGQLDHYDALMLLNPSTVRIFFSLVIMGLLFDHLPIRGATDSELISIRTPSGIAIQAEIADTPRKRAQGLMYRDHLKKDHGMLFFFSEPQAWTFWMKNTKIALDLIWLDDKKRVTHIERNVPICTKSDDSCPQYRPNNADAVYVLEITGGTVDGYQIEKGTKLQFGQP